MSSRLDYGVVFNGRRIYHPGAYDYIDASGMVVPTDGNLKLPIFMGTAEAGIPGTVKWFVSAADAKAYLRGGDLYKAVDLAFSPMPEGGGGASIIGVMVVNALTRASLTAGGMTLTSLEYGVGGNKISAYMEDGTITGSKRLTVYRWDTEKTEVFNNLGAVMSLQYTGVETYADVTITKVNGVATRFTTKVGATVESATTDIDIDLTSGQFPTLQDLITHLVSIDDYEVDYVSNWNSDLDVAVLDAASAVTIKATPAYIKSMAGDIEIQVNNYSELVSVSDVTTLADFSATALTGGAVGATPASWATELDELKKSLCTMLIPLTASPTIHAECLAHINAMELRNQHQVLFCGGATDESISQAKKRAIALNDSRAISCYPAIYHKSVGNGKTLLPAYFTAALIAGRVAGVDPSEPITFDYFDVVGLGKYLLAGDPDIDDLITSGVCTLELVQKGGIRLVQGITTYLGSSNNLYREISVRMGADSLCSSMRSALEDKYVGKKGVKATVSSVTTSVIDLLKQAIKDEEIIAYKDVAVTFDNTAVRVDFKAAPIDPINFILMSAHFVPESQI